MPSLDKDHTAAAHASLRLLRASSCIPSQLTFVTNTPTDREGLNPAPSPDPIPCVPSPGPGHNRASREAWDRLIFNGRNMEVHGVLG